MTYTTLTPYDIHSIINEADMKFDPETQPTEWVDYVHNEIAECGFCEDNIVTWQEDNPDDGVVDLINEYLAQFHENHCNNCEDDEDSDW